MIFQQFSTNGSTSLPTRRDFLNHSVRVAGGVVFMLACKACTPQPYEIDLADAPDLRAIGGVQFVRFDKVESVLVHTSETAVIALYNRCTHKACGLEYDPAIKEFLCD